MAEVTEATVAGPATERCESLYIEAVSRRTDGTEVVYRMAFQPTPTSQLTLEMEREAVEHDSLGSHRRFVPSTRHNVKVEFTQCEAATVVDQSTLRSWLIGFLNGYEGPSDVAADEILRMTRRERLVP
jgi:hypothetical protein